jgi:uroporphyrin-III C-methyltransferase
MRAAAGAPPELDNAPRGSFIAVGAGITGVGQMTAEAIECVRRADRVFYLVVEPLTERWLRLVNPNSVSLASLYGEQKRRRQTYNEMTELLVASVRQGLAVCAVFYGHPGVLARSTHAAIQRLQRLGHEARMLPGVSADGCLYADLGVDPGERGTQSYEATEFMLHRHRVDPTANLLLWQVGALGEAGARRGGHCDPARLAVLTQRLLRHYPARHRIVVYRAANLPIEQPYVKWTSLEKLTATHVPGLSMLFVPALRERRPHDRTVLAWLGAAPRRVTGTRKAARRGA